MTEICETMSQNKCLLLLSCFYLAFCHSNGNLANTETFSLSCRRPEFIYLQKAVFPPPKPVIPSTEHAVCVTRRKILLIL